MGRTQRKRKSHQKQHKGDMLSPTVHHDLFKFLSSHGWRNSSNLMVSSFAQTGRGLYAKETLSEHDLIIEVPYQCLISYQTLENDNDFCKLFGDLNEAKSAVPFHALLALYLCHQKVKGEKSEWMAYIKTLPDNFTTPYFCQKSELYYLPETILEKIVEQNNLVKNCFQTLRSLLHKDVRDDFTFDVFKWAFFVCNSRSIHINGRWLEPLVDYQKFKELLSDEPNMALAPLLDLLNHSDKAKTRNQLSHSKDFIARNVEKIKTREIVLSYQLFTASSINKYEQIFIHYGAHNSTKLLLEYGFIVSDNQMDFLEFSLNDINNYIKDHPELKSLQIPKHKYKFIRDHDLDQQIYIDLNDGLNHNFQAILSILLIPENMYNLPQVAFGDEINFAEIKSHGIEIIKMKRNDFEKFHNGLQQIENLSLSGQMCCNYFQHFIEFIDKVLNCVECL